jgi:exopolysaccharide biosynthesis polyprenyl glycosylphosphotransferase
MQRSGSDADLDPTPGPAGPVDDDRTAPSFAPEATTPEPASHPEPPRAGDGAPVVPLPPAEGVVLDGDPAREFEGQGRLRRPSSTEVRTALLKTAIVLLDVATVAVAAVLATLVAVALRGWDGDVVRRHLLLAAVLLPVWPVLFARQHMYAARFLTRLFDELRRAFRVVVIGVVAMVVAAWLVGTSVSRWWLAFFLPVALLCVGLERFAVRRWFVHRRRAGRSLRDVLIVGINTEAIDLDQALSDPAIGYRVIGFVTDDPEAPEQLDGRPVRTGTANTVSIAHALGAQGVILATTGLELALSNHLLRELIDDGLHVELTSGLRDVTPERMTVRPLGRHPVVYLEPSQRLGWRAVAKRSFDVVVAATGLVLVAPLMAVAAVAIKITSPGPVLFRQERVGRSGRPFQVLKLRTMVVDAEDRLDEVLDRNESDGPLFKLRDDPRITSAGRWLRKLSIDELPQLWNVVRGDMSLVGPRPALPREVAEWDDELFERLRVRPGITGMWQVSGRSDTGFAEYQRLDLFYVDNWSILIDIGILARTVPTVLSGRGAA